MGNSCYCLQNNSTKNEVDLDPKRIKEISIYLQFNNFISKQNKNKSETS